MAVHNREGEPVPLADAGDPDNAPSHDPRFSLRKWARTYRTELVLFFLLWATYGYFYQSTQQNEGARFDQMRAILHDHTLEINKYWWNSADVIHYQKNGAEHIYPNKAPGATFIGLLPFGFFSLAIAPLKTLGVPEWAYWHIVTYLTVVFTVSLLSSLAAVGFYRILKQFTGDNYFSVWAVLAVWLGTLVFPFSTLYFSHQLSGALLAVAFYLVVCVLGHEITSKRHAVVLLASAGLLMGISVATEYPTALLAAILSVYTLWRIRRDAPAAMRRRLFGGWAIGAAIAAAGLLAYNLLAFGKPFYIPYEAYAVAKSPFATYRHGWMGLSWPGFPRLLHALASITMHSSIGILHLHIERWRVYASNPVLWLSLPGFVMMIKNRKYRVEGILIAAMTIAYLLFITSYGKSEYDWSGGSYLGPRHLIPLLPFLAFPLYFGARYLRFVFYPLFALSVFYMLLGTAIEPRLPTPFDNPERDFLAPDFLAGRLAQNTDSLFDHDQYKLTNDSTAFNIAKLLLLPGRYQLAPLMLWWTVAGGLLLVLTARRQGVAHPASVDPAQPISSAVGYDLAGRDHFPRTAVTALFLFASAVTAAPIVHHLGTARALNAREGLRGDYYRNAKWSGDPTDTKVDSKIDFDWSRSMPLQPPFSVEWTGDIFIDRAGSYTFAMIADDGVTLEIDGTPVVDLSNGPLLSKRSGNIALTHGSHAIRIRYFNSLFGGSVRLWWRAPGRPEQIVPSDVLMPSKVAKAGL
jgi:hypothetical protein